LFISQKVYYLCCMRNDKKINIMKDSSKISCPRCGGSGKVEHTHVVEGVCFMCKGFGEVLPVRVKELTKNAKIRKANKDAKKAIQNEIEEKAELVKQTQEHLIVKSIFNKLVLNETQNASDLFALNNAFKMYNHLNKSNSFDSELFIEMIQDYTQVIPNTYRIILVKFFREQGCFKSSLEYQNTDIDRNEFYTK